MILAVSMYCSYANLALTRIDVQGGNLAAGYKCGSKNLNRAIVNTIHNKEKTLTLCIDSEKLLCWYDTRLDCTTAVAVVSLYKKMQHYADFRY